MVRRALLFARALIAAAACGSSSSSSTGPGLTQGAKPQQGPPANVVGGFSIQLPSYTLKPGEETLPCWIFPLDVQGPSLMVGGAQLVTQAGMHHGNVTTRPATGTGIRPCPANDPSSQF